MEVTTIKGDKIAQNAKPIQCNMVFEGEPNLELIKEIQTDLQHLGKPIKNFPESLKRRLNLYYKRFDIDIITLERLRDIYSPGRIFLDNTTYGFRKLLFVTLDFSGLDISVSLYSPVIELNFELKKP